MGYTLMGSPIPVMYLNNVCYITIRYSTSGHKINSKKMNIIQIIIYYTTNIHCTYTQIVYSRE